MNKKKRIVIGMISLLTTLFTSIIGTNTIHAMNINPADFKLLLSPSTAHEETTRTPTEKCQEIADHKEHINLLVECFHERIMLLKKLTDAMFDQWIAYQPYMIKQEEAGTPPLPLARLTDSSGMQENLTLLSTNPKAFFQKQLYQNQHEVLLTISLLLRLIEKEFHTCSRYIPQCPVVINFYPNEITKESLVISVKDSTSTWHEFIHVFILARAKLLHLTAAHHEFIDKEIFICTLDHIVDTCRNAITALVDYSLHNINHTHAPELERTGKHVTCLYKALYMLFFYQKQVYYAHPIMREIVSFIS